VAARGPFRADMAARRGARRVETVLVAKNSARLLASSGWGPEALAISASIAFRTEIIRDDLSSSSSGSSERAKVSGNGTSLPHISCSSSRSRFQPASQQPPMEAWSGPTRRKSARPVAQVVHP